MESYDFSVICKNIIIDYYKAQQIDMTIKDVYIVWECKTLQNNKALLSTTRPDGNYFECTYNGDKEEIYFDVYNKTLNMKIEMNEFKKEVYSENN